MTSQWTILKLAETVDEADVRRQSAYNLRGPYIINWDQREVAVIFLKDVNTVLDSWDVVDRRINEFYWVRGVCNYATAILSHHKESNK